MSWLSKAIIYQIFIDRFAGYNSTKDWHAAERMGGNIRGIIDKFDYIKSLGVNTIWISPFCKATSYHGYDVTDYYAMDEHIGTEADLKELIDLTHSHGLKIIADLVPNHMSFKHPYFLDAQQNPQSPYRDWFIFTHWPDTYIPFYVYPNMPKINYKSQAARDHMLGAARKWLQLGLDGYRVDHVIGLTNNTIDSLFGPLKREFPECAFFGEAAMGDTDGETTSRVMRKGVHTFNIPNRWLVWMLRSHGISMMIRNYVGHFDGMLDFYTQYHLVSLTSGANRARVVRKLQKHIATYPSDFALIHFLDNHDQNRYLFRAGGDISKLLDATRIQFSLPGAKVIYYGTEVGMSQEKSFIDAGRSDTQARQPMQWEPTQQNLELLEQYKQLIKNAY